MDLMWFLLECAGYLVGFLIFILITAIVYRWVFRINEIVRHLEHTTAALDDLAINVRKLNKEISSANLAKLDHEQ